MRFETEYTAFAELLILRAKRINDNGRRFVVWATCLGFEGLLYVMSNKTLEMHYLDNSNISLPLYFNETTAAFGELFTADDRAALASKNLTYFHHHNGFFASDIVKNPEIAGQVALVATARAPRHGGVELAAIVQFRHYPFLACQFHPEKPQFETNPEFDLSLDEDALRLNRKFAQLIRRMLIPTPRPASPEYVWSLRRALLSSTPLGSSKEGFYALPDLDGQSPAAFSKLITGIF